MSERGLLEAVGASATMNRETWHLTYDAKRSLCGVEIHPFETARKVVRVSGDHCGNCRRVLKARAKGGTHSNTHNQRTDSASETAQT